MTQDALCEEQAEWCLWPTDESGKLNFPRVGGMPYTTSCSEHLGDKIRKHSTDAYVRELKDFEKTPGMICGMAQVTTEVDERRPMNKAMPKPDVTVQSAGSVIQVDIRVLRADEVGAGQEVTQTRIPGVFLLVEPRVRPAVDDAPLVA